MIQCSYTCKWRKMPRRRWRQNDRNGEGKDKRGKKVKEIKEVNKEEYNRLKFGQLPTKVGVKLV